MLWNLATEIAGLTLPETIAFSVLLGLVVVSFIWVVRWAMGQRTDPEQIKLSNRLLDTFDSLKASIDQQTESNREQSRILGDLMQSIQAYREADAQRVEDLGELYRAINQQSIEVMQALVGQVQGDHENIQTSLGTVLAAQTTSNKLAGETIEVGSRIEQSMKTDSERLDDLSAQISAMTSKISELVNQVDRLESTVRDEVTTVKGDLATVQKGLHAMEGEIVEMKTRATGEHATIEADDRASVELPVIEKPKPEEKDGDDPDGG